MSGTLLGTGITAVEKTDKKVPCSPIGDTENEDTHYKGEESREKTHQVWEAGAEVLGCNPREGLTERGLTYPGRTWGTEKACRV